MPASAQWPADMRASAVGSYLAEVGVVSDSCRTKMIAEKKIALQGELNNKKQRYQEVVCSCVDNG
jgi:hypothetical protein